MFLNPLILNLEAVVVTVTGTVYIRSSESERVRPVAFLYKAIATFKASSNNKAASVREASVSIRLVFSASVQVEVVEVIISAPTTSTCGLRGNSVMMVTTKMKIL